LRDAIVTGAITGAVDAAIDYGGDKFLERGVTRGGSNDESTGTPRRTEGEPDSEPHYLGRDSKHGHKWSDGGERYGRMSPEQVERLKTLARENDERITIAGGWAETELGVNNRIAAHDEYGHGNPAPAYGLDAMPYGPYDDFDLSWRNTGPPKSGLPGNDPDLDIWTPRDQGQPTQPSQDVQTGLKDIFDVDVIDNYNRYWEYEAPPGSITFDPSGNVTRQAAPWQQPPETEIPPSRAIVPYDPDFAARQQSSTALGQGSDVHWDNGWRTPDGRFASPQGPGRAGGNAEQAVWDAIRQKPGWQVIEGRVSVRNAAGDLRIYDGVAISPRGRVIGLEVKSGTGRYTPSQRTFDAGVNTYNPAIGVGQNKGLTVGRALLIQVGQ
jgi:hypothetical protein